MSLETSLTGRVGTIELNRPDKMNALTVDLVGNLAPAAASLVERGARALVLTGRGPAFCAGADLTLVGQALAGEPAEVLTPLVEGLHGTLKRLRLLPVPLIAAVEGPAVGAGMGLALCADLRILAEGARLVPGYLGIGSSPDGGVSYFLTRMLGSARALSLLLRNRPVRAAEAAALGLAEPPVPDGSALAAAQELAATLAAGPPLALLRVRELVDRASAQGLAEQLDLEQERVAELWKTHDFTEGIRAFLERRAPDFRGE
ncbi:2-(1,2-epoxy-1,2-dihydrophenyl)acetyl-CoA isomerase PaaG [Acrocarpospora macrocephala]|uniref:2-(1,2-epoxy-1,2-dihydrophenyl)acetyl-CoA isomerase n=1 Tax=Acrocarpospora macrocephala TaxID=150177 RepID=A0A5M3WU15_9ACTN|nr:enoyl-CoA hydratase-related protein [Acrocarpospora macrocephala]GES11509.1 2-(1,2-epoxy-1,2-dihydrophenyl)acetyl-CoA isomerase [Acrocarpospora macrocephala]